MTFKVNKEYALKLSKLAAGSDEIAKKAIYAGAGVVADKISANLAALPEESFRHLQDGDQFYGVPTSQKKDLQSSLGITPITEDRDGNLNAKVGFDGYGRHPTKKYLQGVPNQLVARSIESGSSVRRKTPFVRTAVNSSKKTAKEAMENVIDTESQKIMEGK